ncbi:hypothetical protein [Glaciimonas immobilis]|uniref:Uncharacterized protein n=1 Tax=Glaciimonas immobilis TaxID=728004 RepID=A0A840RPP2_9BURK|nr:hypothetical protein [Glaciimonas immobilis]KAF3999434.1 hypothetical protein HAV38_05810 [Glaciimonas immobilis]MBB5198938.1 hypothetical protein [Glaciimonas immobilis]
MKHDFSLAKMILIIFAIIGVLATVGAVGMLIMHGSMMGKMGSAVGMANDCRGMMGGRR